MSKYKPTRTDDNLPSRSTPIRKGKMSKEQIEATAKELTKVPEIIQEVEAPSIDPTTEEIKVVKTPWNYKVYAEALKAMISEHETVEVTADQLSDIFPQARRAWDVARNLSKSHGLSYRRVDNDRNDTYVFFIEPTREELIKELNKKTNDYNTSFIQQWYAIKDLKKKLQTMQNANNQTYEALGKLEKLHTRVKEKNDQLKSDLNNSQKINYILFAFAIWAVITIIFKSVAL